LALPLISWALFLALSVPLKMPFLPLVVYPYPAPSAPPEGF
jgi:hypothetical protein